MLVLSRIAGESIHIGSVDGESLVTILQLMPAHDEVSVLITHASPSRTGVLESRTTKLCKTAVAKIGESTAIRLVDICGGNVRIGIEAPENTSVQRLEVYETLHPYKGTDDGMAGAGVPLPPSPELPSLKVRLDEPPATEDGST